MQIIEQTYLIEAPRSVVWKALVDPISIAGWGAGEAIMDDQVGTDFSLWDGSIWGTNTKVIPERELVQDWFDDEGLVEPTVVTITLEDAEGNTRLSLYHENIPEERVKDIEEGWQDYYLGPLAEYAESLVE
jgi:uncharacterized protein YndB with AHSA1/START domain